MVPVNTYTHLCPECSSWWVAGVCEHPLIWPCEAWGCARDWREAGVYDAAIRNTMPWLNIPRILSDQEMFALIVRVVPASVAWS